MSYFEITASKHPTLKQIKMANILSLVQPHQKYLVLLSLLPSMFLLGSWSIVYNLNLQLVYATCTSLAFKHLHRISLRSTCHMPFLSR